MRKLRVVQIGVNHDHASAIFKTMVNLPELFEVVGYCIPEDEPPLKKELNAVYQGYPQLTLEQIAADKSIDCATIETFERNLTKYATFALELGLPIHMDKPGGVEHEDFKKMIALVKEKNIPFHTGYMYRYNPAVLELMEKVKSGELGRIISVEAQMNCLHKPENRQWLEGFPGGMMFYLGCHLVDLIVQILGMPRNIIPLNRSTGMNGVTAQDFGMAVFEYENGVSFAKTSAAERGGYMRRQLVVTGEKATVELRPFEYGAENDMYTGRRVCTDEAWGADGQRDTVGSYDRYVAMLRGFAAMVRGEKENPWTPDYELELYKTVLRACGAL